MKRKANNASPVCLNREKRVDKWIKELYPRLTNRHIEEVLSHGLVRLKDRVRKLQKGEYLSSMDRLDCSGLEDHLFKLREGNRGLEVKVVFELNDIIAVDKPSGMPSHPVSIFDFDTVTHWAFACYPSLKEEFVEVQPTVVPHRLDIETSGLQLVAKTRTAYKNWRALFGGKELQKKYLAWCWGVPKKENFIIKTPLAHSSRESHKMVAIVEKGQTYRGQVFPAESYVKVLKTINKPEDMFLAEVSTCTGVTHQVRLHMASSGFPLLGDRLYDPCFGKRPVQPGNFLLRAVEILGSPYSLKVSFEIFYSMLSSESGS